MSAGQYFKHCQILIHVLTATESHDLNMDFRLFYNGFTISTINPLYTGNP